MAVIAVAAAAGVLAAVLSAAAPTATHWVDALERALLAGAVTLAASRARRWTLVVGTVAVTVGVTGPSILAGLSALGAAVLLVERRLRSRVVGAAIGGVIGVLALRLTLPGPTGAESLLAAVATIPVLVSGYRRSTLRVRRGLRRGAGIVVAVGLVALLASAAAAALSAGGLRRAATATDRAVAEARDGNGESSSAALDDAHRELTAVEDRIGSWWASGTRVIPVLGANLAAAQRSVDAGVELTGRAASLVSHTEFAAVQRDDGGVDLAELDRLAPRLTVAAAAISDAVVTLREADSTWLVPPLRSRLDDLQQRLDDAEASSRDAVAVLDGLPAMLGADGPRRYLFLLGNPAELRDLGGHIGNWAEVVATDGRIELVAVGRPGDLSTPTPPEGLTERYPASLTSMNPSRYPQNLGATADLPTTARLTAELFQARTGRELDGVAYADPSTLAAFLDITGPVAVTGLPAPFELTADNAVDFLTRDQFTMFADQEASGAALDEVIRTVFDRLATTKLPGPERLGELFGPLVRSGRLQVASLHHGDDPLLERFSLDGAVADPAGRDLLGVFNRNANPSKIDTYLERRVADHIVWNPTTGAVNSVVTVELHNTAPAGGLNRVVGGNSAGAPPGTNVTDLVVLTPFRLRAVLVDGVPSAAQPLLEGTLWRHTVRVAVPSGGTKVINFHLEGSVDPGLVYRLRFVGQPTVDGGQVRVTVDPTEGRTVGPAATWAQDADRTETWRVKGEP